jgi:hypothetical protein
LSFFATLSGSFQDEVVPPDVTPIEEAFGSDLTGVTDSDEAAKGSDETKASSEDGEIESRPPPEVSEEAVSPPNEEAGAESIPNNSDIPPLPSVDTPTPSVYEAPLEQNEESKDTYVEISIPERDISEPEDEPPADEQTDGSVMDVDGTVDAQSPKEEEDHVSSPPVSTTRRRESDSFSSNV